jgi:predicted DNA repair protein MutK
MLQSAAGARRGARSSGCRSNRVRLAFPAPRLNVASSLLTLLDDIATVLDDVAVLTKIAAKKTAGVLGDDLALNAQQVAGVDPRRELPVVWAVAKGSMLNKAILVPAALLLSTFVPWVVIPLMIIGGAFLCFEGVEKLAHKLLHSKARDDAHRSELLRTLADPSVDLIALERDKIRGAIRTDFILSAEIIVISLGTVAKEAFAVQVGVLVAIAVLMTVGVYGLVAGIVKLDDAGLFLSRHEGESGPVRAKRALGRGILRMAPWLMKFLSIAGTAAMFLVGGGILTHNVPPLDFSIEAFAPPGVLGILLGMLADLVVGVIAGAVVLGVVKLIGKLRRRPAANKPA